MALFLQIAERVYKTLKDNKMLTTDNLENLNNLMLLIRKEIKGTKLKLLYNFIDFEECQNKPNAECTVPIDISIIPPFKNEGEFILWLASFIQKVTTDGKKKLPPIHKNIPPEFTFNPAKETKNIIPERSDYSKCAELINSYFKSDEFIKNSNKSH
ncbi:MAG: hypothetical protein BGN93_01175 [Acinetobacter sp. 39-4]|jgi:hypothetical protein|uniref:Uncharacterized protein n=1 Tax=Acinetobacter proteolyticus TaxID=1776741 RepID=A0A2N0WAX1_9GAMM|nr:hypothetical protein [Acinetobacter proteolyticus]OJU53156.1 MAG: hypothetical protein BGN93_01175 [Acinetobacter sp. 39-4]PKF31635.1 hypothetical protein CW311_18035 [Acinetobacter proteolyticus]